MARENRQTILALVSMAALIGYGALLFTYMASGVGGSDSSGYANTARAMLEGRVVLPIEALSRLDLPPRLAGAFRPLAFEPGPEPGTIVPFYPPGFPLHIAFASLVAGWEAGPFVVSPILALLAVVLTYFLGRELSLSRPLAFAGAAIFAAAPIMLRQAVQPMSDVAAAVWCVAAILCALRSRKGSVWALPAGAAFGMAVLVRPADVLLLLPLAFALRWNPRSFAFFAAGGVPFAAFFGFWNRTLYGSVLSTGYAPVMEGEFSWSNFAPRFVLYGKWIVWQLSPLPLLGWLGSTFCRSLRVRDRALLVTWLAAYFLFYCFWRPADGWWYSRFLLPALPALILGFLVSLRELLRVLSAGESKARGRRWPLRALAGAAVLLGVFGVELRRDLTPPMPYKEARGQATFPEACRAIARRAEGASALVVAMEFSGAVRFYTDFLPVRWDQISAEDFALVRARAAEKGYRVFAILFPDEVPRAQPNVPGDWVFLENVRHASLWELHPP